MSDRRSASTSQLPSRLTVFLPAVLVLLAAGAALWLDRQAWRREQAALAGSALERLRAAVMESLAQSPEACRLPRKSPGAEPDWAALHFPFIPEPQSPEAPLAVKWREGDVETVWREGRGQLSAAGLPLRWLAARRQALGAAGPERDTGCQRLRELLRDEPCALAPVIMEEVEAFLQAQGPAVSSTEIHGWRREWEAVTRWGFLEMMHGTRLTNLAWHESQWFGIAGARELIMGPPFWLEVSQDTVRDTVTAAAAKERALPAGIIMEFVNGPAQRAVLAESDEAPALRAVVADETAFARAVWQRTGWLSGLAALAVGGTLWGSRQMLRAIRRQADLSRQRNNFIASVSHELRTPLTSLRVLSENLHAGRVSAEDMKTSYFPLMVDECRRLGALVENVLEFARAEEARTVLRFAGTDLPALIADAVRLVQPPAEKRGILLKVDAPPLPEPAMVDSMSLHRALLNLLDNAVKFTPDGGTVAVSLLSGKPGWWQLRVADTGPGVPPAERDRIFERFYRSGSELTRTVPGSGIGLSIVRHLIEGHGGSVTVEDGPERGAVFTMHLPYTPSGMNLPD